MFTMVSLIFEKILDCFLFELSLGNMVFGRLTSHGIVTAEILIQASKSLPKAKNSSELGLTLIAGLSLMTQPFFIHDLSKEQTPKSSSITQLTRNIITLAACLLLLQAKAPSPSQLLAQTQFSDWVALITCLGQK